MADRSRSPSPAPSSHRSFLAGQNDVVRTGSSDSTTITIRLYLSHFLSTWNSRMFEFAAFLFLAAVFPGTLLFASIYALARSCAVFLLSSSIGSLMDRTNRLVTIRHSIVWQRLPVAASCTIFAALLFLPQLERHSYILFAALVVLACVEKVAATANTVAVERDWVVTISGGDDPRRRGLNAAMRRIDLIAKLVAPLFISLIDAASTHIALWVVLASSLASVTVEYFAIAQVYHAVPELAPSSVATVELTDHALNIVDTQNTSTPVQESRLQHVLAYFNGIQSSWRSYFRSSVLLASLSLCILYFTVLSFNAQMVTYLLASGFSAIWISGFRFLSVVVELGATWAAPILMSRIGPARSGLWFITWQTACAAAGVALFCTEALEVRLRSLALISGVIMSRIGLWGFDLSVQYLVQEEVSSNSRSQFSTTEAALQNLFEMLSFATTSVFSKPELFQYPALISVGATGVANLCFTTYVKQNRGHLFHKSRCLARQKYTRVNDPDVELTAR
ncbi:MAG: hypothetical protein LQ349_004039 [Xanthoria aureola]|nr:MAG: hypothetical protein LQ349_004039 [Xanthoria aureola]